MSTIMANNFVIYTDNNPLTYILTSAKLDAMGHCWAASLANYDFASCYHPVKINVDVDALSCILSREQN